MFKGFFVFGYWIDLMIELIQACSPQMQLEVAQAIIKTESGFNQFAIGVNKGGRAVKQPKNYHEAVATAQRLLSQGANIDMGFAQINSQNLKWLGLNVNQVFDPCANLKAMQKVYLSCYERAGNAGLGSRMQRALSCYNTGNMINGFKNGYVNRVTNHFNYFAGNTIRYQQYPKPKEYIQLPNQPISFVLSTNKVEKTKEKSTVSIHSNVHSDMPKEYLHWDVFKEF